jgi:hypothetical protein
LGSVGITLEFGPAGLSQDQHLAHRLHHVVRHQDQEDIERQRQQPWPFARAHIAEQAQRPLQRPGGQRRLGWQFESAGGSDGMGGGHRYGGHATNGHRAGPKHLRFQEIGPRHARVANAPHCIKGVIAPKECPSGS